MKNLRSRLTFDEFKKKSSELLLQIPSEMMRIVLENAKHLGIPNTIWVNQNRFESIITSVRDQSIFTFVYREDTQALLIYNVFVTKDDGVFDQ